MWAITSPGLHRFQNEQWANISNEPVTDVTEHLGQIIVASGRKLHQVDGVQLSPLTESDAPFPITHVVSHSETLYVQGNGRLTFYDGTRIGGLNVYQWASDKTWDWGSLPSKTTRDALSQGSRLYIAADRGLGLLRGMSLTSIRGEQGLCYEDTTCLANGFDNDLWVGTSRGAIRMVNGDFHYFAGRRWLPDEQVNAIAAADHAVYIATGKGLGIIEYEDYTLQKKADYYERHLDEWGQRRLGFTHKLEWDAPLKQYVREVSDDDGGYTGNYLAAQAYRYAVTKDPKARARAVNTFQALRWLETMTPMPGFIARSVWAKGEVGHQADHGSGGAPAEWHDTANGLFEWKGDTSSDEVCSHFYAIKLFLDELALWSYANLLTYETNPLLRATYRRSLERSYEVIRIEQNPWFNFVYGALTGNDCEIEESVAHLREWPLDLVVWSFQNSHRADLHTPSGYTVYKAGIRPFSPRETEPMRWDHWTMQADGGTGGRDVIEPGAWLLAYWMGRHHGFITPPKVTDLDLLRVDRTRNKQFGAKPYKGPPRPETF